MNSVITYIFKEKNQAFKLLANTKRASSLSQLGCRANIYKTSPTFLYLLSDEPIVGASVTKVSKIDE